MILVFFSQSNQNYQHNDQSGSWRNSPQNQPSPSDRYGNGRNQNRGQFYQNQQNFQKDWNQRPQLQQGQSNDWNQKEWTQPQKNNYSNQKEQKEFNQKPQNIKAQNKSANFRYFTIGVESERSFKELSGGFVDLRLLKISSSTFDYLQQLVVVRAFICISKRNIFILSQNSRNPRAVPFEYSLWLVISRNFWDSESSRC